MKKFLHIGKKIALTTVVLFSATFLNAATKTATANGSWSTPATWVGGVPVAGDDVIIPTGITVTITANASAKSISITGILRFNSTTARTLTISGDLVVNSGGSIDIQNVTGTHSMLVAGNITNNGSIDLNLDTDSRVGLTFNGASNQTLSGTGATNDYYRITVNNSGAANSNIVEVSSSAFTGPATGGFLALTDGIFKISGTFSLTNPVYSTGFTIPAGTGFWLNNANVSVTATNADLTLAGSLRVSAGSLSVGTAAGDEIRYVAGSSLQVDGGNLNIGALRNDAGTTDYLDFNMSSGVLTVPYFSGFSNAGRSVFDINNATSTFTMSGGTIVMPYANASTGGDFKNLSSTVNITGGTLQFGNNLTTTTTDDFDILGGASAAPAISIVDNATSVPTLTLSSAISANGDLTINAGTSLIANGQAISVKGNWTNNGTFTSGTQTTTFNGSTLQTITGATSFSSVTVNNTGDGLSLASNITVSGVLTLTDGIVATSSSSLMTLSAAATVSGGSTGSHINGPLAKTGNSDFSFPIGDGVRYRPISIGTVTGGSAASVVTASYVLGNPRTAYGTSGTGPALTIKDISLCEYWLLDDGAETLSAKVGLQYSSTSPCNTNGYITDAATLVVAHHNGTAWESLGAAAGATLTNMTAATASTFSPFTIGTTNSILNPLPVNFAEVKAFEKVTGVQIDWTNATESDMSAYVIERSADGINFNAIGQTAPRSNQFDKVSYTFTDAAPLAGVNFYRVKAIEVSGKNVFSKALRVDIGRSPKGISLYPNPVRGAELNIGFTAQKGQYSLNVLNTAGQIVYRQNLNHAGGTVAQTISLPASLKAGVYNVLISGDNYKETKMFVKQ